MTSVLSVSRSLAIRKTQDARTNIQVALVCVQMGSNFTFQVAHQSPFIAAIDSTTTQTSSRGTHPGRLTLSRLELSVLNALLESA